MIALSCGCWALTPAEVTAKTVTSDGPFAVSVTCEACMGYAARMISDRTKTGEDENLDFFADLPSSPP